MNPNLLLLCKVIQDNPEPFKRAVSEIEEAGYEKVYGEQLFRSVGGLGTAKQEPRFDFALRFGLLMAYHETNDWEKAGDSFFSKLDQIFPSEIAKEIAVAALEAVEGKIRQGELVVTKEEFKKFFEQDRRALSFYNFRTYEPPQTISRLIPCPKCGHRKRVDEKTKRFICKNPAGCDFNSTFPFPNHA